MRKGTWKNEKHAAQFISTLETYAFPFMGAIKVSEIGSADLLRVLEPIWTEKHETAKRVRQRIGTVLKWAIGQGWRNNNPAADITAALPKVRQKVVHRDALPFDQVHTCVSAVRASNATSSTKLAIEFLILNASRSGEVREARWSEIDLDTAIWTIQAARMKAGKEHAVPLQPRAVAILLEAKSLDDGSGFVFPGTRPGKPLSDATLLKLVRELGFNVHIHGFRSSFRMWAQGKSEFISEIAEKALAHENRDKVEVAYARNALFKERRKLMAAWAWFVAQESGEVIRPSFG